MLGVVRCSRRDPGRGFEVESGDRAFLGVYQALSPQPSTTMASHAADAPYSEEPEGELQGAYGKFPPGPADRHEGSSSLPD